MTLENLKFSFFFTLLLIGVLLQITKIVDFGINQSNYSHYYKVNQIANRQAQPNLAIFGSSVGEVSIDPAILQDSTGLSCYNFSIDGTRFVQYNGLIELLCDYADSTRYVLMVETYFSLSKVNQIMAIDRYLNHMEKPEIFNSLHSIQPELVNKIKYIPFYRFIVQTHPYYKSSALGWLNYFKRKKLDDPTLGYTPVHRTWEFDMDSINAKSEKITIVIDSTYSKQYYHTLQKITQSGKKAIIIIPPFFKEGMALFDGFSELKTLLKSFENDHVLFLDYSTHELTLSKEYFYNNSHLNYKGSVEFSKQLAHDLQHIIHPEL